MSTLSDIREHPSYGRTSPSIYSSVHDPQPSITPASDNTQPITIDTELASMFQPSSTPIHLDPRLTKFLHTPTPDSLRGYHQRHSMVPDNQEPQEEWRHQGQLPEDFDHTAPSYSLITGVEDSIHETHPSDDGPLPKDLPTPRVHTFPEHIRLPSSQGNGVTSKNDNEPDENFFQPNHNERGIKIEEITKLKQDGGFHNYRNWRIELDNAFDADPARYNTAVKRIAFATKYFDGDMKESWKMQAQCHPHLRRHWRKFLRWIEKDHLHGDPAHYEYLRKFYDTTQGEMEGPVAFCIRLTKLATNLRRRISMDDFFPRLQERFQDALIQGRPIDGLDTNWLIYAQNVWDTLEPTLKSSKRKRTDQPDNESSPRFSKRVSIGGRVAKERNRRRANNLCLQCGKDDHLEPTCPDRWPVRKSDGVIQEKALQTQPETGYSKRQDLLLNKGTQDQPIEIDIVKTEAHSSANGEWGL